MSEFVRLSRDVFVRASEVVAIEVTEDWHGDKDDKPFLGGYEVLLRLKSAGHLCLHHLPIPETWGESGTPEQTHEAAVKWASQAVWQLQGGLAPWTPEQGELLLRTGEAI